MYSHSLQLRTETPSPGRPRRRLRLIALGSLVLALLAGCSTVAGSASPASSTGAGVGQPLRSDVARGAPGSPAAAAAALDTFGAALLSRLPAGENAVLSPYSIYAVLAMARAGAKGATAAQLDAVLGAAAAQAGNLTAIDRAIAAAVAAGKPRPTSDPDRSDTRPVTIDVANSIWLAPSLPVQHSYLDKLAAGFGVGMYQIDYAHDPAAARQAINSWIAQRTHQLIPELLADGSITADTAVTLVNAMYLSAPWASPLMPHSTPQEFTTAGGSIVQAASMGYQGQLRTAAGPGWTSVTIPYRGDGLAMTIVLPDAGAFAAVRAQLGTVLGRASAADLGAVTLTMPKFRSQTHLSLRSAAQAMGIEDLFQPTADLSGIAGKPGDIVAGDLIHQSVISVDEKGTEAAAATALNLAGTAMADTDTKIITVDRPFFYAVHDTVTGAPLFLGQVTDPTA